VTVVEPGIKAAIAEDWSKHDVEGRRARRLRLMCLSAALSDAPGAASRIAIEEARTAPAAGLLPCPESAFGSTFVKPEVRRRLLLHATETPAIASIVQALSAIDDPHRSNVHVVRSGASQFRPTLPFVEYGIGRSSRARASSRLAAAGRAFDTHSSSRERPRRRHSLSSNFFRR